MMALKACGLLPLSRKADTLDTRGLARLAQLLQDWRFCVLGTRGLESAQVTAGGALTAQFDPRTMQSRLAAGLFACGEVLDIDGDCGGYNLQWAWSSGRLAGISAAEALSGKEGS
jgi:predicted flavoprotein YhiN